MELDKKQFSYGIIILLVITNIFSFAKIYKDKQDKNNSSQIQGFLSTDFSDRDLENNIENSSLSVEKEDINTEVKDKIIYVHISGEVKTPGLARVMEGKRVKDVIDIAGGLTDNADIDRINLAQIVRDEEKIYVPKIGENISLDVESEYFFSTKTNLIDTDRTNVSLININIASKEELESLPGIGPKTAKKIIEYRTNNKFVNIEDLMDVSGIGEKKFEAVKEMITTN